MSFFEQDSESDECEETEEEFLERYAKAAVELEDSEVIDEADEEEDEIEIDLGKFVLHNKIRNNCFA